MESDFHWWCVRFYIGIFMAYMLIIITISLKQLCSMEWMIRMAKVGVKTLRKQKFQEISIASNFPIILLENRRFLKFLVIS